MSKINESKFDKIAEENLSDRFNEYLLDTKGFIVKLLGLQKEYLSSKLTQEQRKLQTTLDGKENTLKTLLERFEKVKTVKKTRTARLYFAFVRGQNKRKLNEALNGWISYYNQKKKNKTMTVYTVNYFKRGFLRKIYKEWKKETQKNHREKVKKINFDIIQQEIFNATSQTEQELNQLRKMIGELTEDLKNENYSKNQLKYKFEQALARGISALDLESTSMYQEFSQGFSSLSQGFSPNKT